MIINVSELYGGEGHYLIKDDGWFPHEEMDLSSPVSGVIRVSRTSETEVVVSGEVSAGVEVPCDRCGQSTQLFLSAEFAYDCTVGREESHTQQEVECGEEDVNKLYLEEPVINAGALIREQILLAMPMRALCKQSCKGLCMHCGKDLNAGICACSDNTLSSPFSVLQKIKGR